MANKLFFIKNKIVEKNKIIVTLYSKKYVGMCRFSEAVEEEREVVVIVQRFQGNLNKGLIKGRVQVKIKL